MAEGCPGVGEEQGILCFPGTLSIRVLFSQLGPKLRSRRGKQPEELVRLILEVDFSRLGVMFRLVPMTSILLSISRVERKALGSC